MSRRSTIGPVGRTLAGVAGTLLLVVPTAVRADDTPPTTEATTSTTASSAPPGPVAPEPAGEGSATVTAVDETSYRAALEVLSTAPTGPNTLVLGADVVVDDGTDPTYTGTADLVVEGGGHTLDAAGASRLLAVDAPVGTGVTLRRLTLTGGRTTGDGGAVAIRGGAGLTVEEATLVGNRAGGDGGAVAVEGNVSSADSTFTDNAAGGAGGAIHARSAFALESSTFAGNTAAAGGALAVDGTIALRNVTVTGNAAEQRGGGVVARDAEEVILVYATLAGNRAPSAANLDVDDPDPIVLGSALADPLGGGANCGAPTPSATASFSDDASCGDRGWAGTDGADARLGLLADNGGATPTMLPAPDSPLVDAIDPLAFWGGPTIACTTWDDQRGVERPQDGNGVPETGGRTHGPYGPADVWCDIGAVERETPPPPAPAVVTPRFTG